ncbi:ParB/RepB/Spo0J family partition protein, partial [Pantoea endophytica]
PPSMPQVASSVATRSASAPAGSVDSIGIRSEISRPEMEPSGQIVRVRASEIYEVEQVRPEEDFEDEVLDGMVDSFSEFGNLTPPRCFPKDRKGYRVWFGATRVRSMKRRGDEFIDIYVGSPPRDERQRIMGQLIENLQQSGLKPLATAMAFERLKNDFGMSGEDIAKALGKPTAFISKHMRIGSSPEKIRTLVKKKKLSDVELIYNLIQLNEVDEACADEYIDRANEGKNVTRAQIKKELRRIKNGDKVPTTEAENESNEISHAKFLNSPKPLESESSAKSGTYAQKSHLDVIVKADGMEGRLMGERTPDEFGMVWVLTPIGELYIEAAEVSLLGLR